MRRAAGVFDLRRIIGGLFVVYGLLLAILGLFDSDATIDRAAGVNINLWGGIGMLVLGILFLIWSVTRPLADEFVSDEARRGAGDDDDAAGGHVGTRRE